MSAVALDISGGPFDPESFSAELEPAVVHLAGGHELFVAHHVPEHGGWLSLVGWAGSCVSIPPGRVAFVEPVETAAARALDTHQRIVDEDLRREAATAIETGSPELADGLASLFDGGGHP